MRLSRTPVLIAGLASIFVLFATVSVPAKKKPSVDPATYWAGKSAGEAAAALLDAAQRAAGDGSWENLAVARVWYLSGQKEKAGPVLRKYEGNREEAEQYFRRALEISG